MYYNYEELNIVDWVELIRGGNGEKGSTIVGKIECIANWNSEANYSHMHTKINNKLNKILRNRLIWS